MKKIVDRITRYAVTCARAFELDADQILSYDSEATHQGAFGHENFKYAAGLFLALYVTEHPDNPYFQDSQALDLYLRLTERWVSMWENAKDTDTPVSFSEWPPLMILRGLELISDQLSEEQKARREALVTHFVEEALLEPFFFTAPNHECWKLADCALAGRILDGPEWMEAAEFKANQILTYQTPEGFWEEGRHHGPSMKYNSLMLAGLSVIAQETGSERILDAATRLSTFMARWSFPDGVTVGAFDGRQSTSPGYFGRLVPGLELAPEGVTHIRRIMEFWERTRWLDEPRQVGPSYWYAHFGMPFAAESLLHYSRLDPTPEEEPAMLDTDGTTLENHTPYFDGILRRQGPWSVAVSSQLSDVPKDTQFRYRLERQNRIEIHHEKASVVLGGGHSLITCHYPLCNVWVDSGHDDKPSLGQYANSGEKASSPEMALRRSKYYARAAASGVEEEVTWLELVFAHATVRFEIEPSDKDIEIRFGYDAILTRQLRLALPLVLWRGANGFIDGESMEQTENISFLEARKEVRIETPIFDSCVTLALPETGSSRVVWPLEPVRTYGVLFEKEAFDSFFRMAQVEAVIDNPSRSGSGRWILNVK